MLNYSQGETSHLNTPKSPSKPSFNRNASLSHFPVSAPSVKTVAKNASDSLEPLFLDFFRTLAAINQKTTVDEKFLAWVQHALDASVLQMVGDGKEANLFISPPPTSTNSTTTPPSKLPVRSKGPRRKPLSIEDPTSFPLGPFPPQSPKSKVSRRATLTLEELKDSYPLPQRSPISASFFRRPTLSTASSHADRNFSVHTLPDDDIHNAAPHRSSLVSSRTASASSIPDSPSRIPVLSRTPSTSTIADDIYIPETPTRKGSAPPPLSLEHFSFLVKNWKEKVEQERPPTWPLADKLEKQPEHEAPSGWPGKFEHPHFQPKETLFEVDNSSDDDVHVDPLTVFAPPEAQAQLSSDTEVIPFAEPVVDEPLAICTREPIKPIYDPDEELKKISKQLLRVQKYALTTSLISINGALIFMSWWWIKLHWIWLPMLTINTIIQVAMIICIVVHFFFRKAVPREIVPDPETLETMAWVLPCYNETPLELTRSLESLARQAHLDDHKKVILVVVDGKARGKGMDKSCGESLLEDILPCDERKKIKKAYIARDALDMTIELQKGRYQGIPYICVVKEQNQGKRDSLVFIRSMLYNFNRRHEKPETMFSPNVFNEFAEFFVSNGLEKVDFLAGMDADTVFDDTCIWEMIKVIRQEGPETAGVCGHVCVDFEDKPWGFWNLFQSTEYTMTQGLRRAFQSAITGKVNCLPGCCQLIRVCEASMGDKVLKQLFGHVPKPNDSMIFQVMGNYSEDSIHASYIFSEYPKYHTAQALRAKAYTTVPQTWSVFLSQRKRWSLGSISNDLLMACRPRINPFERCISIISVFTWFINPFITAAAISFAIALIRGVSNWRLILGLASLLMIRYLWEIAIVCWIPRSRRDKLQYLAGLGIHVFWSPILTQVVLFYSLFHSDDFKWGKTREVVEDDDERPKITETDDLEKQLPIQERQFTRQEKELKEKEAQKERPLSIRSVSALAMEARRLSGTGMVMDTPKKLR